MQHSVTRHRQHGSQASAATSLLDLEESPPPTPRHPSLYDTLPSSPSLFKDHARPIGRAGRTPSLSLLSFSIPKPRLPLFHAEQRRRFLVGSRGYGWKRLFCGSFTMIAFLYWFSQKLSTSTSTLVFRRDDLQRIWRWEVASGHYPSRSPIPAQIQLQEPPGNPAIPPHQFSSHLRSHPKLTQGTGAQRQYFELHAPPSNVGFPPRPIPGSIIDFDEVMRHCAFERHKAVPDCLEFLRVGAGLDNGRRVRTTLPENWKYNYVEVNDTSTFPTHHYTNSHVPQNVDDPNYGLQKHDSQDWELSPLQLPNPSTYFSPSAAPNRCHSDNPRIFHIFWTGPFTDKPYLTLLSFLFSQNTGLHLDSYPSEAPCRPQLWLWIDPGITALSQPHQVVENHMLATLRKNPWASPFLHPRLKDVIHFKLWNTEDQLDSTPELKDHWRTQQVFRSEFKKVSTPKFVADQVEAFSSTNWTAPIVPQKDNKVSVILSDMVRFVLCHRYGGVYLDADTLLLRDWEEIWGSKQAFAYRWSRLPRYNTAVLRLNKGSALGTFILRTAVKNDFDFHPTTVTKYVKDAHVHELMLELPDALFDPAWLAVEKQQDRFPQPYFKKFEDFFDVPSGNVAAPQVLGVEGFFRGAYSYHYHNSWWRTVDPGRNWPDLGSQFIKGENLVKKLAGHLDGFQDERDLAWATVLKRIMESYIRGERPNMYGEMLKW
ncbi:hypothetical protein CPB83DRAFT_841595 [Crepidotus variabilis]|uniref:Glycosyltransferase family 32 protein n=1 Tax=Crepidotus variabilis TaxID=179855 RepID=A0A9P6JVE6_9AGAR|nr:hypothetical protein CPB83DRAFT_841595 [Crepidotus variabilis]